MKRAFIALLAVSLFAQHLVAQQNLGPISTPNLNGIRFADRFPGVTVTNKLDAAIGDCAGTPCLVIVPAAMGAGNPTSIPATVVLRDFRTSGAVLTTVGVNAIINAPGNFSNLGDNCALQGMVNGASMSLFSSSGAGFYTQDGVCGAVIVPLGATVSQANGVTGIVEVHANGPVVTNGSAGMGGYFQTHMYGANSVTWGINTVGVLFAGANNTTLQNETDFDVKSGVTGAKINAWSIQFPYLDSPGSYWGVVIGQPGCTTPDFGTYPAIGCPQLQAGFASIDGAAPVVLSAGTNGAGNNHGSQAIQLSSVTSGGTRRTANISADANGNLIFGPTTGLQTSATGNFQAQGLITGNSFATTTGSAVNGLTLAPVAAGASVSSQRVAFTGTNAASAAVNATIGTDLNGTLYLTPQSGQGVNFAGSGATATISAAGQGGFPGGLVSNSGATTIVRCTTAGTLRVGQLTSVSADCAASVDTGLRTP